MQGDRSVHRIEYSTTPTPTHRIRHARPLDGAGWALGITVGALAVLGGFAVALGLEPSGFGTGPITLLVFGAAVACWISGRLDDTFVALAAAGLLVIFGALETEDLFETLGSEPIWLLVAAFVLAAGVTRTGLPMRLAIGLIGWARSPRQLAHLITLALVATALAIPSTSGRAALVLPVYTALATTFAGRERLVRALGLLFPTVVLLSAVASLVGAGAHLITGQLLDETVDSGISFAQWLLWGLPLAVVSSHVATEIVLLLFTRRSDRRSALDVDPEALRRQAELPPRMLQAERRAASLLAITIVLWSTEAWHGLPPALVALCGALAITLPNWGSVRLGAAISEVPWSLLLFMAATAALGTALTSSGVAEVIGNLLSASSAPVLLCTVIVVSLAAHLLLQSRSARSSVLIPLVIPAAAAVGLNPTAVAFASTAAAGFCQTLPSSAKPVALFSHAYTARDLLKLSAVLGPVIGWLVLLFAVVVWPRLGLPLH